VNISDRDRRIILILVPIVVLIAYWFLILGPKRDDLKTAQSEQQSAEQARLLDLVRALELPVLSVGAGVLVVPLVGSMDSRRIAALQR